MKILCFCGFNKKYVELVSTIKKQLVITMIAITLAPLSLAQDPVKVAPKFYKVLFENELIRVLENRYGPMESSVMHSHPRNLVIALSDGLSKPVDSEGGTAEYRFKFGDVIWREAVEHIGTNSSDQEMHLITIEFKEQK